MSIATPNNLKTAPVTFKEKIAALRNIPTFFKLVWETNSWMMIASSLLRIIRSALPVAILYFGKLIIDDVIALNRNNGNHTHLWLLKKA